MPPTSSRFSSAARIARAGAPLAPWARASIRPRSLPPRTPGGPRSRNV